MKSSALESTSSSPPSFVSGSSALTVAGRRRSISFTSSSVSLCPVVDDTHESFSLNDFCNRRRKLVAGVRVTVSDLLRLTEWSWWISSGVCTTVSAAGCGGSGWRIESDRLMVMDLSRSNIDGVRPGYGLG